MASESVNLAVSGYATDQELLLWEREGRRYCADLVLLGLYENDVRENGLAVQGRYPKPYFRPAGDGGLVLVNSPVPRLPDPPALTRGDGFQAWVRRHLRVWAALAFVRQVFRGAQGSAAPPAAPPGGVELTAALIERLAARVVSDGSGFAVVVLPDLYYLPTTMQAVSRTDVATFDLAPVFRRVTDDGGALYYRLDGAHWTPRAHRLAADAIAQWIVTASLLPRSPGACAKGS